MGNHILSELFRTNAHFQKYAPGYDTSDNFDNYNANAMSVKKEINDLITLHNWDAIIATTDTEELEALRLAVANKTLYKYAIFRIVSDRKSERGDTYKYEFETMRRQYIDNYHSAMSTLLPIIAKEDSAYNWADTPIAKMMDGLQILDVEHFQRNYYIDTSFLYFVRTIPIQRNLLLTTYKAYYEKLTDKNREDLSEKLDMALVYNIVSVSLRQFDLIEFPPTMHSYFDDNTLSRNGKDERNRAEKLADKFLEDANSMLGNIDLALTDQSGDSSMGLNINKAGNKFYFLG